MKKIYFITMYYLKPIIFFLCFNACMCLSGPKLTVWNATESRIHIEWTLLKIPNKVIKKYQVSAYPIQAYTKLDTINRNLWSYWNTTYRTELVGLHPGTRYNISVWAVTSESRSDSSTEMVWTVVGDPEEPPPVEILERNKETMSVRLPFGWSENGPITNYFLVPIEKSPIILFNPEEVGNYSMSQETGIPYYITANLNPDQANKTFVIGDKNVYNGFYNAPLSEGRDYEVLIGAVSSLNGITKVAYSPLQSALETQDTSDITPAQSSTISVVLSAAIGVCGFLLVLSVILYFLLRRHYGKRRPSDEMVLRVHGSEGDGGGYVPGMLHISDDANLEDIYYMIQEKYSQIPPSCLETFQSVLGVGQFGEVRDGIVHRRSNAIPCSVLCMQEPSQLPEKERKAFLCELEMMSRYEPHVNVVEFFGACDEKNLLEIVMEHHPSSLRGLLLRSRQPPGGKVSNLSEPLLLELASGIALGMAHLADRGVQHRHLSTRNILIAEGSIPKIAHFGLGHYNPLGKKLSYTRWTAPEVLNLNHFSSKSDVWSFGVLLWEIFTFGGSPYVSLPSRDVLPRVMQGMRLPQPKGVSDDLFQLLLHCWELDADERPRFMELATSLQKMLLDTKEYVSFQDCVNYQYAKFDPNAEDQ